MKTMKIEKQLLFTDRIIEVANLQVKDGLTYSHESEGIRAVGPLFIRGEYRTEDNQTQIFQEVLDMDVLAPMNKLAGDEFLLEVKDFQGTPDEDGINVSIHMNIHGMKDDHSHETISAADYEEVPVHQTIDIPVIPQPRDELETASVNGESVAARLDELGEFEDLFEDSDTTYTSYRIVVAKPNDTYAAISTRYEVSEEDLRTTNKNKEVQSKTLVILPFQN